MIKCLRGVSMCQRCQVRSMINVSARCEVHSMMSWAHRYMCEEQLVARGLQDALEGIVLQLCSDMDEVRASHGKCARVFWIVRGCASHCTKCAGG
jgi:hypothetical protein